jgi:hypothetical protein
MNKRSNRFSPEVRKRAVRMVQEHSFEYPSLWAAAQSIAPKHSVLPEYFPFRWGHSSSSCFGCELNPTAMVSDDSPVIARRFTKQKAQPCGLG